MLVVTRFSVPATDAPGFRVDLDRAREALAERPGYLHGTVGRNVDDPDLWVLTTRWEHVGAYRRALQRAHVERLAGLLNPPPPAEGAPAFPGQPSPAAQAAAVLRSDIGPLVRAELETVRATALAAARSTSDRVARAHFTDLATRAARALDPDA